MSAESAAERIVISCLTSGAERRKVQNICAEAASIIREETRCDQLAEALDNVCASLETMIVWAKANGWPEKYKADMECREKVMAEARAVLARARGESRPCPK